MNGEVSAATSFWSLAVFFGCAVAVSGLMILVSYVLGEKHSGRTTGEPYESGMPPTGAARTPFTAKYYIVAMLFVIFDVEALFIYAWAVALRGLGWPGYTEAVVFIGILLAALVYLSRMGALDWGTSRKGTGSGTGG